MATKRKDSKNKVLRNGESQRSDGRYVYRYTDALGNRHSVYAKDLNELRNKENEVETYLKEKLDMAQGNVTLHQYAKDWLEMKHNVSDNTMNTYRVLLGHLEETELGHMKVAEIRAYNIKDYLNTLVLENNSYGYIHLKYTFIRLVFADAVTCGAILTSPCNIKLSSIVKRGKKQEKYLTKREEKNLWEYIKSDDTYQKYYLMIYLMLNTGLRIGEVSGLTWNDIDFREGSIKITHQIIRLDKKLRVTDPKSDSANRTVYISDELCSMLQEHKKIPRKIEPMIDGYTGFVFLSKTNEPFYAINFDNILRALQHKYEKATGNSIIHLSAHLFRHTYCSRLVEKNVPPKIVQYIMGHSDITTTMDVYAHLEQNTVKEKISATW